MPWMVRALGRLIFHVVIALVVWLVVGVLVTLALAVMGLEDPGEGTPWGGIAGVSASIAYVAWRFSRVLITPPRGGGGEPEE